MAAASRKCPLCGCRELEYVGWDSGRALRDVPVFFECKSCSHRWQVCGARTKSSGKPCARLPTEGRIRCNVHGSASNGAPPKDFSRSKYRHILFPAPPASTENLTSLEEEIIVVDDRIQEVFGQISQLRRAGHDDSAEWAKYESLVAQRRDLCQAEVGRLYKAARVLNENEALRLQHLYITTVLGAIEHPSIGMSPEQQRAFKALIGRELAKHQSVRSHFGGDYPGSLPGGTAGG